MRVTHIIPKIHDPFCNYTLEELMTKDRPLTTLYVVEATEAEVRSLLPEMVDDDRRFCEGYFERYPYNGVVLVTQAGRVSVSHSTVADIVITARDLGIREFARDVTSLTAIRNLL